ncbi:response regulator [Salipiger sp. IMCC34102]|nr:response regulator [Salipiger sp. IMCC34102]
MAALAGGMICVLVGLALLTFQRGDEDTSAKLGVASEGGSVDVKVQTVLNLDATIAYVTDPDGSISFANRAALERFGKVADRHLATALGQILAAPEDVMVRLQEQLEQDQPGREDIVTRSGQYRLSVVGLDAAHLLWRLEDIGRTSRNIGRAADHLTLPMMTAGSSDSILFLNEAFRKLLGARPKTVAEVFGDRPLVSGQRYTLNTTGGDRTFVLGVVQGPAGRREIFLLSPGAEGTVGPDQPVPLSGGWNAIEDLPVPLLKIDKEGRVAASNREARGLLGLDTTEDTRVADVLDGLGRPIGDWIKEALAGKGGHVSQFLRGRGGRQETFVQVTLNTAEGPEGRHLIAVLNDVTELKTLEAQFVQSQKMQAIGQLAGGVAHDFNNLLTAISGHCDLLLLRHDQGDHDYGDLIQIHQNANRAASLVGQLLAFSRKQNLQPERIDLRDILSDLAHLLNRLVGEKVTLTVEHEMDLAAIKADRRQLEQVIMNLVVNARDAMAQGGEIRIKTESVKLAEPEQRERVTVPAGDYVVIRVMDEGCGIPPDRLPKIFEPFYTTKRTGEGTGLGLSTVYGIVKQSGGYIFAHSEPDNGTEFEVFFPSQSLPVADTRQPPVQSRNTSLEQSDGVVLLVEDEAPVRAFASRALRLRGYTVLEADCAEVALELLSDKDLVVDIFVTDVIMPGKDGPSWVREALVDRPETPVVFVSGYSEDAFNDGQAPVPNAVFLAKPFSLNALTDTVNDQLASKVAAAPI